MSYHIREFDGSDSDREEFERFGLEHYRGDPFFRPAPSPPDSARCFLLLKGETICGRAAVVVNPGISVDGETTALIGWYECIEEPAASIALLDAVTQYCNRIGAGFLLGPMNGDTWHSYRFAGPSKYPPFFLDVHHKPWYAAQFEDAGYTAISSYHSTRIPSVDAPVERIERAVAELSEQGIRIREFDTERFDEEMGRIYSVSIDAFRENAFYTPISEEEMIAMYAPLRGIIDAEFVLLAEDDEKNILAFVFGVRNLFAPANDSLVVKTAAVRPAARGKRLGSLLIGMLHVRAARQGFRDMVHALMHDENVSAHILDERSRVIRRYRLYGKKL